jgi:hypothetical protein
MSVKKLGEAMGQFSVVDKRGGGSGNGATEIVAGGA